VCWLISILGVWLGWELWYNFWRNWGRRLPAIEPIYFSLSASTHLSLASFDHFNFLLHTRLSPLGTHHATDIIPETAYLVTQLAPGLLPLGVRACIAGILLLSFWRPEALVPITAANPLASASRDPNFFDPNHVGQLMPYAKAVLLTFVGWVGLRVVLVALSGLVLWVFSFHSTSDSGSGTCVDPADWNSPATSWRDEAEFQWGWRERARARIQNAFELCIVRPRYAEPEKILAEEPASTEFIPVQPYESEPCSPVEAYVPAEAYSPAEPYSPIEPYPEVNTGVVAPAYNAYEINVGRDLQGAALHNSIVYQEALVEDELPRTLRYSQKRVPVPKITSSDCDFGPVYPTRSTDTAASGATSASVWAARFRTERNSLPARPYSDGDKYTHVYEPEFGALGARSHSSTLQSTQGLGYSRTRYRPTSALDDLASLKHFMDREATPSPQFQGGLAWIRFKATPASG
jgi:hypothetical protein